MCGITGYYLINKTTENQQVIKDMINSIKHRGPDDQGIEVFDINEKKISEKHNLALSNARLSILDLSKLGHQPMFNEKKDICIVYNGEIFNYLELKQELEKKGHKFKSKTDTEVIIYAYEEWGVDCLKHFNGMWGFALYDMNKNILFCSRDRFGIKPFYYYRDENSFVFGSEIKTIFEFPIPEIRVNEQQIMTSIIQGYRYIDGRRTTFYKRINQLLPAEYLVINFNDSDKSPKFTFKKYWEIDFNKRTELKDEQSIINKFRELLIDAVKIRLRSDVPYAFTLSGGMDSSSIVSIANKVLKKNTIIFSAIYDKNSKYDEQEYILPTIRDLNAEYYLVKPQLGDFFKNLKMMIKYNDEPICTVTFYSQWQVMKKIKEMGFTVVLTGYAADEIVSGYYDHYLHNFYDLMKKKEKKLLYKEINDWMKNHDKKLDQWEEYLKNQGKNKEAIVKEEKYKKLFKEEWQKRFIRKKEVKYDTNSRLTNRMYNELKRESVPVVLKPEDRNSMMFSLESRVPFLDYRLVEFCYSIPNSLKIRNGLCKYILREAMKGILNEKVRTCKKKVGFNAPMDEWIKNELKEDIEKLLSDEKLRIYQFLSQEMLLKLWVEHKNGKENHMMLFWNVLNIEFWLRYVDEIKRKNTFKKTILS